MSPWLFEVYLLSRRSPGLWNHVGDLGAAPPGHRGKSHKAHCLFNSGDDNVFLGVYRLGDILAQESRATPPLPDEFQSLPLQLRASSAGSKGHQPATNPVILPLSRGRSTCAVNATTVFVMRLECHKPWEEHNLPSVECVQNGPRHVILHSEARWNAVASVQSGLYGEETSIEETWESSIP